MGELAALDELVVRRRRVADVYDACIARYPGIDRQEVRPADEHAWVHYVLRLDSTFGRDKVAKHLSVLGVDTRPYYAPVLHRSEWPGWDGNRAIERHLLPATDGLEGSVLALPMSSEMTPEDAEGVVFALDRALGEL
jgi:dTDP-4-amino-4,6-dideoxygalactose transaminase